jgi:hypothetical protein
LQLFVPFVPLERKTRRFPDIRGRRGLRANRFAPPQSKGIETPLFNYFSWQGGCQEISNIPEML